MDLVELFKAYDTFRKVGLDLPIHNVTVSWKEETTVAELAEVNDDTENQKRDSQRKDTKAINITASPKEVMISSLAGDIVRQLGFIRKEAQSKSK